ncbi:MAG TPA: acyl-CoA dehydrogenase family protein, partial [Puia sp.]|nr:acyl-CoA dehydrogenase family protein [Puia sp.]
MDFSTEELTEQVGRTARDFANQSIRPHVMEWDEKQEFPHELFRELGRLGMMGVVVPEVYGGSGLSYTEY